MKSVETKRMRFGRLPKDETISSKQLQVENKVLEERLAAVRKFCEEEKKKADLRQNENTNSTKSFAIRDLKRISLRPSERDQADLIKEQQGMKAMFAKKGIRAYEEVVKNRKKLPEVPKEKSDSGLTGLLESLNMGKFLPEFKKAGINSLETLKSADVSKLGLLPGFEIKLNKKLNELRFKRLEAPQGEGKEIKPKECSDDESDFLSRRNVPVEKPRRYRALLNKQKSIHEDSTMSDLKQRQSQSVINKHNQEDFCCGPEEGSSRTPEASCWNCLALISTKESCITHPILAAKVFCSIDCLRADFKTVTTECGICRKIIVKPNGVIFSRVWYCSEKCLEHAKMNEESHEGVVDIEEPNSEGLGFETEINEGPALEEADLNFTEFIN